MSRSIALAVLLAMIALPGASPLLAAEAGIGEIRAYLFLERSGTLSANIVGSGRAFHNTVIGEGDAGEPASNVLVDVAFTGGPAVPAGAAATVVVTQGGGAGRKTVARRTFTNFLFGDSGTVHRSLFLEDATCQPLEIAVRMGKVSRTARIDFHCGE